MSRRPDVPFPDWGFSLPKPKLLAQALDGNPIDGDLPPFSVRPTIRTWTARTDVSSRSMSSGTLATRERDAALASGSSIAASSTACSLREGISSARQRHGFDGLGVRHPLDPHGIAVTDERVRLAARCLLAELRRLLDLTVRLQQGQTSVDSRSPPECASSSHSRK